MPAGAWIADDGSADDDDGMENAVPMAPMDLTIPTRAGDFRALDYGGSGPTVLALHELFIHNAASWGEFAEHLNGKARVIALDREGHGQTGVAATPAIDIVSVLADVVEHLGCLGAEAPVLVGCGSGGWDATLAVVAGGVTPRALLTTEATYCVSRDEIIEYVSEFAGTDDVGGLWAELDLGWRGSAAEKDAEAAHLRSVHDSNWIVGEMRRDVWEATVERSFVEDGDGWLRQPITEAMIGLVWERIHADPCPGPEAFTKLTVPATFILAEGGLYSYFAEQIDAMVASGAHRNLRVVPAINNILSTHAGVMADEVLALLERTSA